MNKIYWDKDKISIFTNQFEAVEHKHWALQLFLALEDDLKVSLSGKSLKGQFIIVNRNVNHSFSSESHLHLSVIIEPTSDIAVQLSTLMGENEAIVFDNKKIEELKELAYSLFHDEVEIEKYQKLMTALYSFLGIYVKKSIYDDRIRDLLKNIETCACNEHTIASFAENVFLSPSRLSHLFKEQVGMPLKSYLQFHQIQKAFLAILNGKSITEAAMLANFDSPSHLAAVTKKLTGMPASISLKDSVFLKVFDL